MTRNNIGNNRMEQVEQQLANLTTKSAVWEAKLDELSSHKQAIVNELKEFVRQQFEEFMRMSGRGNETNQANTHKVGHEAAGMMPHPNSRINENSGGLFSRVPNVEFPKFNGENPRNWIRKCNKYFLMNPTSDYEKIVLASMYMEDRADHWYQDYVEGTENMLWDRFVDLILRKFSTPCGSNVVGEFNKLRQEGSIEAYPEQFEELKSFMVSLNRSLTEEYVVMSFISGLKEEIEATVLMMEPNTLVQVFHCAKLQQVALEATMKSLKDVNTHLICSSKERPNIAPDSQAPKPPSNKENMNIPKTTPNLFENYLSVKILSRKEMANKSIRGLCFDCIEVDHVGHKCKNLFVILATEEEEDEGGG